MLRNLIFIIIAFSFLLGCEEIPDPFEDIEYTITRNGEFYFISSFPRVHYYQQDTVYAKIEFSNPIEFVSSAYCYNTYDPEKTVKITKSSNLKETFVTYPIDIDYPYDSIELVAVFESTTKKEIVLLNAEISKLYSTNVERVYNIAGKLANGYASVYNDSYSLKGFPIDTAGLKKEDRGAVPVAFLMNYNPNFDQDQNFQHSFTSFRESDYISTGLGLMNGTKFVKLTSTSIKDFKTPEHIIRSFEINLGTASFNISDIKVGDLYAVRIVDSGTWWHYDIQEDRIKLFGFSPEHELQYAILEILYIADDLKTENNGGSNNDFFEFRLLTFTPPRSKPVFF